jgi:hypothetical protein
MTVRFGPSGEVRLPPCSLVQAGSASSDAPIEYGADLMQWGSFSDVTADGLPTRGLNWHANDDARFVQEGRAAFLRLDPDGGLAVARPIARSGTPGHRYYRPTGVDAAGDPVYEPIDGEPRYTWEMRARSHGPSGVRLRIGLYYFDDSDPTTEPVGVRLGEAASRIELDRDGRWHSVRRDLTAGLSRLTGDRRANFVLPALRLGGTGVVDIDDVRLLEWRRLDLLPAGTWVAADALSGPPNGAVSIARSGCPGDE